MRPQSLGNIHGNIFVSASSADPTTVKFTTADGVEIEGVREAVIRMCHDMLTTVELEICPRAVDIKGHADITFRCPLCEATHDHNCGDDKAFT